ncbi:YheC/YheD family endospore coat-associated protein [Halalkalibacter okhensis]|uniref:Alpha-L-glutamate ligase n=1 Tax=Halalkalibacter okhensis TaxID=333138 RepID=A0A0B0IJS0_9BACI|nr:YheC/YheD family protein [Halalkalibacter okhensis]KHF39871.1 hypothetical protein LQ50_12445 [Halalkalibacter okhensis]
MVTVGMLSHRKDPKMVYKSYAYAAAAKMEGVEFYFFSPGRVHFDTGTIEGWVYESGQWIQKINPFPDVIYNASSAQTEKQEEIVKRLGKIIPFTSHPIGSKWDVFQRLKEAKTFAQYLIPSIEVKKAQEVIEFLRHYKDIVLKPFFGHQGQNIIHVMKNDKSYLIERDKNNTVMNVEEFTDFINSIIEKMTYLAQAYIDSKTKSDLATHFRLHVQKDGEGKWNLATIFPCVVEKGIVANISNGGYTMVFEDFLKQEFNYEYFNIKRYLEHFSVEFSKHFDSLHQNKLDELGIDVGLDKNQKIWIFEVNWRPGTPPTFSLELDVAKQMIRYARYLALKGSV